MDDCTSEPASGGQVAVWWGAEIGPRRNNAMIAWDYDADLVVFKTMDCDVSKVWRTVVGALEPLGDALLEHDPGFKYRMCLPSLWPTTGGLSSIVRRASRTRAQTGPA